MIFMTNSYNSLGSSGRTSFSLKRFFGTTAVIALVLMFFNGCEEDPSRIGSDILPNIDFDSLVAIDDLGVDLYTMFVDTIRSDMPTVSYMGGVDDPIFGTTTTGAVSQVWLYSNWPGNGIKSIDSVMFYLDINAISGEMTGLGTLNVYEIDEVLSSDSVYYVNRDPIIRDLLFSVPIQGVTGDTLITYKIPISVGYWMTRDTSMLFLSNDSADFRTFFKGLYFEYLPSVNDHILNIDMVNGQTFFNVHYTNAANASAAYSYSVNSKCIRYNRLIHDFSTADPDKKINHINDYYKDTLSYVQSFQGVFTRVEIPGLEDIKSSGITVGVNKAYLVFPAYYNDDYYTEDNLLLSTILARFNNTKGIKEVIPDYLLSAEFFNGAYYSLDGEFRINIVNFVQKYIEGEIPEPAFEIFLPSGSKHNVILRSNNPDIPVRLELVYTVLY